MFFLRNRLRCRRITPCADTVRVSEKAWEMPQFVITRDSKLYKEWVFPHADIMMIGGAPTNTLVLPDRSQKVSQYHAAIVRAPGPGECYFIRDLGSLHATKVGGEAVYQRLLHERM